jgi:hypothetical protein
MILRNSSTRAAADFVAVAIEATLESNSTPTLRAGCNRHASLTEKWMTEIYRSPAQLRHA